MRDERPADIEIADPGPLTDREAECLLWVARGKTSWEAGRIMGITEQTANAHILAAGRKLDACNRVHLVAKAFVAGILKAGSILILLLSLAIRWPGLGPDCIALRAGRARCRQRPVAQLIIGLRNTALADKLSDAE